MIYQWIDFNNHNGEFYANFGELVRTLDTDLEYMRSHTQLLVKALEWDREEHDSSFLLRGKALKTDTSIEPGIKPPPEIPLEQVLERVGFSDVVSDADYAIRF